MHATLAQASRQKDAGHPDQAGEAYRNALAYLQGQPESEWVRFNLPVIYYQLGIIVQLRGQLDEAEDLYRKALAIEEELGDQPHIVLTQRQLGTLGSARQHADDDLPGGTP